MDDEILVVCEVVLVNLVKYYVGMGCEMFVGMCVILMGVEEGVCLLFYM